MPVLKINDFKNTLVRKMPPPLMLSPGQANIRPGKMPLNLGSYNESLLAV